MIYAGYDSKIPAVFGDNRNVYSYYCWPGSLLYAGMELSRV